MDKSVRSRPRVPSWSIYGTIALAGLVTGGIFMYWATGSAPVELRPSGDLAPSVSAASASRQSSAGKSGSGHARNDRAALREQPLQQGLKMDAALGTSTGEATTDDAVPARAKTPSALAQPKLAASDSIPLDLRVPEPSAQQASQAIDTPDLQLPSDDPLADSRNDARTALQLGRDASPTPRVESFTLFNPEYGLRGFMAQSWVNNSFGVQGGLGFNDGRRIETESKDIRDDIAVGMGVIMAF